MAPITWIRRKQWKDFAYVYGFVFVKNRLVNSPPDRIVLDEWLFQKHVVRTKFDIYAFIVLCSEILPVFGVQSI